MGERLVSRNSGWGLSLAVAFFFRQEKKVLHATKASFRSGFVSLISFVSAFAYFSYPSRLSPSLPLPIQQCTDNNLERGKIELNLNLVITETKETELFVCIMEVQSTRPRYRHQGNRTNWLQYRDYHIREIKPTSLISTSTYNRHQGGEVEAEPTRCITDVHIKPDLDGTIFAYDYRARLACFIMTSRQIWWCKLDAIP